MRHVRDFVLPDATGRLQALSSPGDEETLALCFTPTLSSHGCEELLRSLAERTADVQAQNAALVVVAPARPEDVGAEAERLGLPFPLLPDPERATGTAFGIVARGATHYGPDTVGGLPASFIIDRVGSDPTVRFRVYGANPRLHAQLLVGALSRTAAR